MICSRKDVDTRPVKYNFRTSASQQGLEKSGKIGKRLHPLVPPIPQVGFESIVHPNSFDRFMCEFGGSILM